LFSKILIANRGEIACRVIKTARRMGIATVAVYSEADRNALHVEMADEAVLIGPAPAAQSYLVIDKIVKACLDTGAEAVHPGYGFLSERSAFPKALAAADIRFIGPNPAAIDAMGDKIESKKAASRAKVSTVPGFMGVVDSAKHAAEIAEGIGYPVMIKASAGGGGKGMRVAHTPAELMEGFDRARSEAASSFGDDRMFIEKFIENPRHIEIQVLGDKHGNVIALGERECSIQRRNQKVLEEAPSPLLDEKTRRMMCAQAVSLAEAVKYDSAGTVEFVAGQDRSFFFLEMNTRLQVEHPVTELITGIDLVEEMIRVAAGEKLRHRQEDIRLTGWAVESRIYAEDPTRDFLPSIGRLTTYRPPEEGTHDGITVRNDTGVTEGREISINYDPMIAKLVTHAPTRLAAIDAQAKALDSFVIEGLRHNISFLSDVMQKARWREGRLSTRFIAEEYPDGFVVEAPKGPAAIEMAAVAVHIDGVLNARREKISGQLHISMPRRHDGVRVVRWSDGEAELRIVSETVSALHLKAESSFFSVESDWTPGQPIWNGIIEGRKVAFKVRPAANGYWLAHGGRAATFSVFSPLQAELARLMPKKSATDAGKTLLCPMPGTLMKVFVEVGQKVGAGDPLALVEAMKMENVLRAERGVEIKSICVTPGEILAVDAVIMEFA
jgi:propionyl-CoA carboxylase alpha chain